jgi:energy-coupling factor transport system permease protein
VSVNRYSLFTPGNSLIHRLDPRTKLAFVALAFLLVLVFNDPRYLAAIFCATIIAALLSGPAAKKLFGFATVLLPVLLATIVLWPLFEQSGDPLFQWRFIRITDIGVLFALAMAQRIVIPSLAALLLFLTTRRRDVVAGLVRIGLPYQVGFGITIAFGFIPALVGIGQTIVEAQRARGLAIGEGGIFVRLKQSISLIVPLMITAMGSVQNLAFSMDSRGYGANRARTYLHDLRFSTLDRTMVACGAVVLLAAIGVRLSGHGAVLAGRL